MQRGSIQSKVQCRGERQGTHRGTCQRGRRAGIWPASGRGSSTASACLALPAGAAWLHKDCEQWSPPQTPGAAPPAALAPHGRRSDARRSAAQQTQSASAAAACQRRLQTAAAWRWCIYTANKRASSCACQDWAWPRGQRQTAAGRLPECQSLLDSTPPSLGCLVGVCPAALCQSMAAVNSWELKEACAAPAPSTGKRRWWWLGAAGRRLRLRWRAFGGWGGWRGAGSCIDRLCGVPIMLRTW
jgi:type II secretory pathway pseudopilin PulG